MKKIYIALCAQTYAAGKFGVLLNIYFIQRSILIHDRNIQNIFFYIERVKHFVFDIIALNMFRTFSP